MAKNATIRTLIDGDWTIKIEGVGTCVVRADYRPLYEYAVEAKIHLTGEAVFAHPSLDETIKLLNFFPETKTAVLSVVG